MLQLHKMVNSVIFVFFGELYYSVTRWLIVLYLYSLESYTIASQDG